MSELQNNSGLATINNALIYHEIVGEGQPFVMMHASVADHRQVIIEDAAHLPNMSYPKEF